MPKQKKILVASVVVSLSIHLFLLIFLQSYSHWFNNPQFTEAKSASFALEKIKRDQILKESFAPCLKQSSIIQSTPISELAASKLSHLPILVTPPPLLEMYTTPASFEELLSSNSFPVHSFALPKLQHPDLFTDLPKDLISPTKKKLADSKIFLPGMEEIPTISKTNDLDPIEHEETQLFFSAERESLLSEASTKVIPTIPIPALPEVPTLRDLETVNLSNSFDTELTFSPRTDGPGYLFALTLIPRADLQVPSLRQHLSFLIDRSNSIQHERLRATKSAIFKAIEGLNDGDTFNIIAFDSKMEKFSPTFTKKGPKVLSKISEFLNKIQLGSFFSSGDIYRPLFTTIPAYTDRDELYTTILITDGEALSKKSSQKALTRNWTLQNQGRVSLYVLSMDNDPNLATLDVACHFNRGRLIYANSHRGLKRKLLKLTKNIKHPIAKNISFKTITNNQDDSVEISPMPAPAIYLDQPYTLLGSTDSPEDFILFVQGRLKNHWFNIKKTVSFVNARKGGNSLKSEWALQKAYRQYEKYILEGDQKYLAEAKSLLSPFNLQVAFQ
jgi:hypothetical protein